MAAQAQLMNAFKLLNLKLLRISCSDVETTLLCFFIVMMYLQVNYYLSWTLVAKFEFIRKVMFQRKKYLGNFITAIASTFELQFFFE